MNALAKLKLNLETFWLSYLKRATGASQVQFLLDASGLTVRLIHATKRSSSSFSYQIPLTEVLPSGVLQKKMCTYARDVVQAFLTSRGF